MLSLLKFSIKWSILSLFILTLGNWIHWGNASISEIVKTTMAPLENSHTFEAAQKWAASLTRDARRGLQNKVRLSLESTGPSTASTNGAQPTLNSVDEKAPPSERQKLQGLSNEISSADAAKE